MSNAHLLTGLCPELMLPRKCQAYKHSAKIRKAIFVAKLKFTGMNVWLWNVFAIRSSVPPSFSQLVNHANMFQRNS